MELENYLAEKDLEKVLKIYSKDQIMGWTASVGPNQRDIVLRFIKIDAEAAKRYPAWRGITGVIVDIIRLRERYRAKLKLLDQQAADLLARIRADNENADLLGGADNVQSAVNAYLRGQLADLHNQHADLCVQLADLCSRRAYNFQSSVDVDADRLCDQFADLFSPRPDLCTQRACNFQSAVNADHLRGPLAENVHSTVNADIRCQLTCLRGQFACIRDQLANNVCSSVNAADVRSQLAYLHSQLIYLRSQLANDVQTTVNADLLRQLADIRGQGADIRGQLADLRVRVADLRIQHADESRGRG